MCNMKVERLSREENKSKHGQLQTDAFKYSIQGRVNKGNDDSILSTSADFFN